MKKIIILIASAFAATLSIAQEGNFSREQLFISKMTGVEPAKVYNASVFGVKSNGLIDNTASFQKAVDFISGNGGGALYISVGRYLTGAVQLKDNVAIYIRGTVVGSSNIFDYQGHKAIFWADGAQNISIAGGVMEGQGEALRGQVMELQDKGLLSADCPLPSLVWFKDCRNVRMHKVICRYPASGELYVSENSEADIQGCINDTKE